MQEQSRSVKTANGLGIFVSMSVMRLISSGVNAFCASSRHPSDPVAWHPVPRQEREKDYGCSSLGMHETKVARKYVPDKFYRIGRSRRPVSDLNTFVPQVCLGFLRRSNCISVI